MNITNAELKCSVSKSDFLRVYQLLLEEDSAVQLIS